MSWRTKYDSIATIGAGLPSRIGAVECDVQSLRAGFTTFGDGLTVRIDSLERAVQSLCASLPADPPSSDKQERLARRFASYPAAEAPLDEGNLSDAGDLAEQLAAHDHRLSSLESNLDTARTTLRHINSRLLQELKAVRADVGPIRH